MKSIRVSEKDLCNALAQTQKLNWFSDKKFLLLFHSNQDLSASHEAVEQSVKFFRKKKIHLAIQRGSQEFESSIRKSYDGQRLVTQLVDSLREEKGVSSVVHFLKYFVFEKPHKQLFKIWNGAIEIGNWFSAVVYY